MSRKKLNESNIVQIGIFTDKDKRTTTYNQLILQILLTEQLETRPLARKIKEKMSSIDIKETDLEEKYKVQKIYSVIQRKESGRLTDLKNKGYIEEENGKWDLTLKGFIALSVKYPDLVNEEIRKRKDIFRERLKKKVDAMPNDIKDDPLGVHINIAEAKPRMIKIDLSQMFVLVAEEAKVLILRGIDLDRINEEDLLGLIIARRSFLEKARKQIIKNK